MVLYPPHLVDTGVDATAFGVGEANTTRRGKAEWMVLQRVKALSSGRWLHDERIGDASSTL